MIARENFTLQAKDKMPAEKIKVALSIESAVEVHAALRFQNNSSGDLFLFKPFALSGSRIENDLFTIAAEGQKLRYGGPMIKRREPQIEDFVRLAPNAEVIAKVRLDDVYRFLPGEHRYQIFYSALHPAPDHSEFIELTSNRILFSFRASRRQ